MCINNKWTKIYLFDIIWSEAGLLPGQRTWGQPCPEGSLRRLVQLVTDTVQELPYPQSLIWSTLVLTVSRGPVENGVNEFG